MADGISVAWSGLSKLFGALEDEMHAADRASKIIVAKSSALLIARAKANIVGSHKKGTPTPASPGEGPANITGYLRRSITAEGIMRHGVADYSTHVGPTAIYGRRVELGYNYPFFEPAARDLQPEFEAIALEAWRAASNLH